MYIGHPCGNQTGRTASFRCRIPVWTTARSVYPPSVLGVFSRMFSFRTLGSLELRSDSGLEVTGVLSSQKLVALLAYLAVATPRGLHRRDTVIGLLWPELNQERARAALRHSVYRLRGLIGAGAILSRGDEDIGIDPAVVSCDAVRFDELLEEGKVADALLLYEGDLLAGFFVRGAPEYERWLDTERTRLRKRASGSACRYAEHLAADGKRDDAAQWARRSLAIAPDDEQMLRRVLTLLAGLGETAGALREYESFAQKLAAEYDASPAPETKALAAKLRAQPGPAQPVDPPGSISASVESRSVAGPISDSSTTESPAPALVSSGAEASSPPRATRWRRISWPARGALLATAAALIGITGYQIVRAGDAAAVPPTIAVLPFDVRGAADLDYLREGMSDLLSIGVDGAAGLQSADPRAVLSIARQQGGGPIGEAGARKIARIAGAGLYITGSVVEAGGRITITASLYDNSGRVQSVARTRSADKSQLFELVDELARELLAGANRNPTGLVTLAARTTSSIPALRSYLAGERELRAGRHTTALDAFTQAVTEDSTFALAYYRLSSAGRWTTEYKQAEEATDKAVRFGASLPPYARRLLAAATAMRDGAYARSESLYVASTRSRPSDAEAWFGLGDLHYHFNALRGRSKSAARSSFERALAVDPGDGESRTHLLELAAFEGKVGEVDSLLAGLPPGSDWAAKWPIIRALIVGDRLAEEKAVAPLRNLPDRAVVRVVIHSTAAFPNNLEGAARVVGVLTQPARSASWRAYGYHLRSQIELARGRWNAARSDLTAMGALEPAVAIEYGALLSLSPSSPMQTRDIAALRSALASWNAGPTPPSVNAVFAVHNGTHPQLRLYLLGLVSTRLADTSAALRYADSLATMPGDSTKTLLSGNLARAIRARVIHRRGDVNGALAALGQPWIDPRTHRSHYSSMLAQVADRYFMAELLREAGRFGEALDAYSAVGDYSLDGLMYMPLSHLKRGDIHLRLGDRKKAAEHYARFVHLWKDCDPSLRPQRLAAERRLAQLRGGG